MRHLLACAMLLPAAALAQEIPVFDPSAGYEVRDGARSGVSVLSGGHAFACAYDYGSDDRFRQFADCEPILANAAGARPVFDPLAPFEVTGASGFDILLVAEGQPFVCESEGGDGMVLARSCVPVFSKDARRAARYGEAVLGLEQFDAWSVDRADEQEGLEGARALVAVLAADEEALTGALIAALEAAECRIAAPDRGARDALMRQTASAALGLELPEGSAAGGEAEDRLEELSRPLLDAGRIVMDRESGEMVLPDCAAEIERIAAAEQAAVRAEIDAAKPSAEMLAVLGPSYGALSVEDRESVDEAFEDEGPEGASALLAVLSATDAALGEAVVGFLVAQGCAFGGGEPTADRDTFYAGLGEQLGVVVERGSNAHGALRRGALDDAFADLFSTGRVLANRETNVLTLVDCAPAPEAGGSD